MFLCGCALEIYGNFHFVVNTRMSFPTEDLLNASWLPGRGVKESYSQLLYLYSEKTCPSGCRHSLSRRLVHGVAGDWTLTEAGKIHQVLGSRQCPAQAQAVRSPILITPVSRMTSIGEKNTSYFVDLTEILFWVVFCVFFFFLE